MKKIFICLFIILFLIPGCNKDNNKDEKKLIVDKINNSYIIFKIFYGEGIPYINDPDNKCSLPSYCEVYSENMKSTADIKTLIDKTFTKEAREKYYNLFLYSNPIYKMENNKLVSNYDGGCETKNDIDINDIKIMSNKTDKIIFKIKSEEYKLTKEENEFLLDKEIFKCKKE